MRATTLLTAVLAAGTAWAQYASVQDRESLRLDRITGTARLWAAVKFFHPYLAYRDIDWDGALIEALPKITAAQDKAAYAAAIGDLLKALNDPVTRIAEPLKRGPSSGASITSQTEPDGVLLITIPASGDWNGMAQSLRKLNEQIGAARAVVFDMRAASPESEYALSFAGVFARLTSRPVTGPGYRMRFHSGYAPADGFGSGGYYSGFSVIDGRIVRPDGASKDVPAVFVVSSNTAIPAAAVALQASGRARIVSDGPLTDAAFIPAASIRLPENITVRIRLGELVYADGTTGFTADITAPAGRALETAVRLAREPEA
ncbi:MAG TPA: hypothetical protein VFL57_01080, partial [Bryobacteraceae bacterium]|nr:hypothetical protein [Bryobacteraceae bacterium]